MPRAFVSCWLVPFSMLGLGCATPPVRDTRPPQTLLAPRGIIFVADGAGGGNTTTRAFRRLTAEEGKPLVVEGLNWSHGYGRYLADQRDSNYAHERGLELANRVMAFRAGSPSADVYLVGHSAGCSVILYAAETLPPGSVRRIILLAPSVSADRDVRPSLRAARDGVDVFCSRMDWFYLGLGTSLMGTADGPLQAAAGRVGFRPIIESPADASLYEKLQQHFWDPAIEWTGNRGGHYGQHETEYLRAFVMPLL
jgi:pimeloyl-ACP methyl ester carboxylesterase